MSEPRSEPEIEPRIEHSATTVTLVVPAKPGRIFDLLATPYRLPDIDPTGAVISDDNASPVTAVGQVFRMNMVTADGPGPTRYQTEHRVTDFVHNRLIAWTVSPAGGDPHGWSWRFELAPLEGKGKGGGKKKRTEVTLTYDWSETSEENRARFGIPDHDAADLEACLTRLAIAVKK
jgi:uncharacterized protein YndB with AHSA1/START domain